MRPPLISALSSYGTCLARNAGFSESLTNTGIHNVQLGSSGAAHEWFTGRRCLSDFPPTFALVEIFER